MTRSRVIVAGRPDLIVDDRPETIDRRYRFRAYLKGRTAGGFLVGHGPTEDAAVGDLELVYKRELAAVRAGRRGLATREVRS